ncbi:MAG: choice-of-anchor tandem repeat GloVer-containing protein [Candidatus Korobacteraceae bacterium]|jgi:uncharacterized repeat protein (TIGR03803 family)
MTRAEEDRSSGFARLAGIAGLLILLVAATAAQAQTLTVLHAFTGGADGANPAAGLTMDSGGRLYGTAEAGAEGFGTVFKIARSGSSWTFAPLYVFTGGTDGGSPAAAVTFGPDGVIYGTAQYGGNLSACHEPFWTGCGVVFELRPSSTPPRTVFGAWNETVIFQFNFTDGALPASEVLFDAAGNLYGTTIGGGSVEDGRQPGSGEDCDYHCGVVYELSKVNGSWDQTAVYLFTEDSGSNPYAGLVFDHQGNLYGAASFTGPAGYGSIFELTPSGSGFGERLVHAFSSGDGGPVYSTLVMDAAGNLYGANPGSQNRYDGTVFSISSSHGFSTIYTFGEGQGPYGGLTMAAAGNLYGTTPVGGANNFGSVFKLTPSNGGWIYSTIHDFVSTDGCQSTARVLLDASGNLYGTSSNCGANGYGTVWEITP